MGVCFVCFLSLSSSGNQVIGEHTVPCGPCVLTTSLSWQLGFLGLQQEHCLRYAACLLWGADLRPQPSWQMSTVQDPRKMWLAAGSLLTVWWRMPVSVAEISPCLQALAVACPPLCLRWGEGSVHSWLTLLWYSLSALFCEWARQCIRLESFAGKFWVFVFVFWLSHSLGCYLMLALSDCPQAWSLP